MKALALMVLIVLMTAAQADTCVDYADIGWMYAERGRQGAGVNFDELDELQAPIDVRRFVMDAYTKGTKGIPASEVWDQVYNECTAAQVKPKEEGIPL